MAESEVATIEEELHKGGRPRDEAREQAILAAALELLAEVGYEAMSIEAVAVRAKSSKATIYRRWPGKAELVADAIKRQHGGEEYRVPDTGSLRGDLLAVIQWMFDAMAGPDGGLMCGLAVAVRADPALGQALESRSHESKTKIAEAIVARAVARGELPARTDFSPIMEVAPGCALMRAMSGQPLDRQYAEHLVDRILIPLLHSTRP
jgi:AcrR family transcriptional regulator